MSLRLRIKKFGSDYQLIRQGPGVYTTDGYYAPAIEDAPQIIRALIVPLSGRDIRALPEGQAAEDTRTVYTKIPLYTRTPTHAPDQIEYMNDRWRVTNVSNHDQLSGGPHYVAQIVRQTSEEDPV